MLGILELSGGRRGRGEILDLQEFWNSEVVRGRGGREPISRNSEILRGCEGEGGETRFLGILEF